jgi:glycosyltransferase involved in cell wall biosynthesis
MSKNSTLEQLPVTGDGTVLSSDRTDRRAHVLFLIDQLYGVGGAEQALLHIIRLLPSDKFRCSLATFRLDPRVESFQNLSCPVHFLPLRRTYDWSGLRTALKLRDLIRSQHVDVVHTFFETSDLFGGLVAKLSGCPVLISSRRDMGIYRSPKHRVCYRLINPMVDRVVTVSDAVRSRVIQHERADPTKVITVYNGVDLGKAGMANDSAGLRSSLQLEHASHLVVTVANFRPIKRIEAFLRAAQIVCQEFPRAMFLVIGGFDDPEYSRDMRELTNTLGLKENVRFLGKSSSVFSLLKMCDVFCLLSQSEGFSNALLEAMACGLPCIATDVGGNSEAIRESDSGFLVSNEDEASQRILALLRSPERARAMGEAGGRIAATRFSVQGMVSRMTTLYEELLEAKQVPAQLPVRTAL